MAQTKVMKPIPATPNLKRSGSSGMNQTSIAGFFKKSAAPSASSNTKERTDIANITPVSSRSRLPPPARRLDSGGTITPAPSSEADLFMTNDLQENTFRSGTQKGQKTQLSSPLTPASSLTGALSTTQASSSPRRQAKKVISYAESEDDDDDVLPNPKRTARTKRRKSVSRSEDDDSFDAFIDNAPTRDGASDDAITSEGASDENIPKAKKQKRPSSKRGQNLPSSPPPLLPSESSAFELPEVSTAQTWKFDADAAVSAELINRPPAKRSADVSGGVKIKAKAWSTKPEERYEWLANLRDADRNPPGHSSYDPRTVYIPPKAWANFSPFETQYWKIKQKFMDTIVFFKKGKFYELYEQDATIGHQLFDFKLTDRVNMRMVGVPEMSLDHWANQFVAAGFKIARVDQQESALGKEMREREGHGSTAAPKAKIIERKLACVLTSGTLVDSAMLQDDMSTYCVSIKETEVEGKPAFGISYVDAATGQFFITEFVDDLELTKFETFIAQIRPQELILEKSLVSAGANRIIKNNTMPTTIRNELKAGKEFWTADATVRELEAGEYFVDEDGKMAWPQELEAARGKDLLMSSFGALVQYLRTLQIERELLTLKNVSWYDPIRKANSLVLDGKTLINLEIFANNVDGGGDGTLFNLLNRCITPFGKRLFKQWVCHPLMDASKIDARLDAVDALNADTAVRDRFTSQLSRLPDLERMISRIHAGSCKPADFVRVLDGFEQIDYTMDLLRDEAGSGSGLIGLLIDGMPDMKDILLGWKDAFDHDIAKSLGLLIPERGVEQDFDASQDLIAQIKRELDDLLYATRKQLGSSNIVFRDNGKEIYQLEVPVKVKGVPKSWDQMSATQQVKRYYHNDLRALIRSLQEAQETHAKIVKEVSARFFARFDEHYTVWLTAVRTVSHLDCLMSLAKASASLGSPSCRPVLLDPQEADDMSSASCSTGVGRTTIDFSQLRHPCMLSAVADFIPNDIQLGGSRENINLLTGANAAGKSTVLRMTCIAVIMAQIGCYVPAESARLTPTDRIMSRLGANDNIFAAQSTFFVELSETKKILSEATNRSLVILDELGRGTSSYDGVAVAEAVLHHIASHVGCLGFFATHYHSLAAEFATHPEIRNMRMDIAVDNAKRHVTFLYTLVDGVAEGSFGMHCASMCGIPMEVVKRAEDAAKEWEHTSKLQDRLGEKRGSGDTGIHDDTWVPLGLISDLANLLHDASADEKGTTEFDDYSLDVMRRGIAAF